MEERLLAAIDLQDLDIKLDNKLKEWKEIFNTKLQKLQGPNLEGKLQKVKDPYVRKDVTDLKATNQVLAPTYNYKITR